MAEVWEALGDVRERAGVFDAGAGRVPLRPPRARG